MSTVSPTTSSHSQQAARDEIGGRVVDFDSHYYETDDFCSRHIEPKYRDLAVTPKGPEGSRVYTMGDRAAIFLPPGWLCDWVMPPGEAAGALAGKKSLGSIMGDEEGAAAAVPSMVRVGDFPEFRERSARLKVMDGQGVQTIVVIPNVPMLFQAEFGDRPDAVSANLRAFNRWLEEEWGFGDGEGRIFSAPVLSLLDLDWAVQELERVAASGARLVILPQAPVAGRSPADPVFDPFWARMQALEMKLLFHIGFDPYVDFYGLPWGEDPRRGIAQFSAFQHYIAFGERPTTDTIAALILHNLFGRFPGLQVISVENGSAWVPSLLRQMDKAATIGARGEWLGGPLKDLPSDVFRQHVLVNPFHEEDLTSLIDTIGSSRVLFGSDWPHTEGLPTPLTTLPEIVGQLGRDDGRKVMYENGARALGLVS